MGKLTPFPFYFFVQNKFFLSNYWVLNRKIKNRDEIIEFSWVCANSLMAMTSAFQVDNPGSIPGWRTNNHI